MAALNEGPFTPPLIRAGAGVVSAHTLEDGALVPRMLVPLIRRRQGHQVVYGLGEREQTYTPPATPEPGQDAVWADESVQEYDTGGPALTAKQLGIPDIHFTDSTYSCLSCGSQSGFVLEWVAGAIHHAAALECRTCWYRDGRPWVADMVRRLISKDPATFDDGIHL